MPFPAKTLLTSDEKITEGSALESAPVEMGANKLILAFFTHAQGVNPECSIASGDGQLVFDIIHDVYDEGHGKRLVIARAMPTSNKTDTVKATLASNVTWGNWGIVEVSDVAVGANGANAIVQQCYNTVVGGTSMAASFAEAFASSDNATIAFATMGNGLDPFTWNNDLVSIHHQSTEGEAWNRVQGGSAWYDGQANPSIEMGWNAGSIWGAELSYSEGGEPSYQPGKSIVASYGRFPIHKLRSN